MPQRPAPDKGGAPTAGGVVHRVSGRAHRLVLRVAADGRVSCTRPRGFPLAEARAFAAAKAPWIEARLNGLPPAATVTDGIRLPVEGRPLRVSLVEGRAVRVEGDALLVPEGDPGPATARWLRELAAARAGDACARHVAALGRPPRPVRLKDTRSRWGSCTARGVLMLSWRLAMAPPEVLSYVAAHEAAHLERMDHSPAFWAVVERLDPDWRDRRAWLRRHGPALMRWRLNPG